MSVRTTETRREPKQPRRFEKKKNTDSVYPPAASAFRSPRIAHHAKAATSAARWARCGARAWAARAPIEHQALISPCGLRTNFLAAPWSKSL